MSSQSSPSVQQPAARSLYASLLGPSWAELAEPVRLIHSPQSTISARGEFHIVQGPGLVAWMVGALMRLPRTNRAAQTRLVITARGHEEQWHRTFENRPLDTRQYALGKQEFGERLGLLEFRFRLEARGGGLVYRQVGLAIVCGPLRLGIPAALAPQVAATEGPAGPRQIAVSVRVVLPVFGSLVSYDGIIHLEELRA
jgi:Domain of unknown function (DUF4166)